jgi:hypothetical protein
MLTKFTDSKLFLGLLCVAVMVMTFMGHPQPPAHAATLQYFAPPRVAAFTPTGQASISATTSSANVALATNSASSPAATTVIVTNQDATATVFVLLGTSNAVAVTTTTGMPIPPHGTVSLNIGANTYIAAIGSATAVVGVTTGQ